MDPAFEEVAALAECGAILLTRHTRLLQRQGDSWQSAYLPTVRNNLRFAEERTRIALGDVDTFAFDRAIQGQNDSAIAARTRSGHVLAHAGWPMFVLDAFSHSDQCLGQACIVRSSDSAILLHSWFDRSEHRGVPTLLVDRAIKRASAEWQTVHFDFEGSVIPSVDWFMAGFGARVVAYSQLRWNAEVDTKSEGFR